MNEESIQFIESWGSMGVFWGINRSMARIHAYILISESPVDLESVSEFLNISRGNASMCLKELRHWRVIQRIHQPGDRKDYYISEPDMWKMFFAIAKERKRREFDPALDSLQDLMNNGNIEKGGDVYQRLSQMETIFESLNKIADKFLESDKRGKTVLNVIKKVI